MMNKKIIFRGFRIALFVVFFEGFLRLGGVWFLSVQDYHNKLNLNDVVDYRILSLGGSMTTQGGINSYPSQLENILNQKQSKVRFKVINKGKPGNNKAKFIADNIEEYIEDYKPHMVTVMTGMADEGRSVLSENLPKKITKYSVDKILSYKLLKGLWKHAWKKNDPVEIFEDEAQNDNLSAFIATAEERVRRNPTSQTYQELAVIYSAVEHDGEKSFQAYLKAAELEPRNYKAQYHVGGRYLNMKLYDKALQALQKTVIFCPRQDREYKMLAYKGLAETYIGLKQYDRAESVYKKAIEDFPQDTTGYLKIAELYQLKGLPFVAEKLLMHGIQQNPASMELYDKLHQQLSSEKRYDDDENLFKMQLNFNRKDVDSYLQFANFYIQQQKLDRAQALLRHALNNMPQNPRLLICLGKVLVDDKQYQAAKKVLTRVSNIVDDKDGTKNEIYRYLIKVYEAQGQAQKAEELKTVLNSQSQKTHIFDYYNQIKTAIKKRDIQLVVVGYPRKDTHFLRKMFGSPEEIFFVDNKENFELALSKEAYDDYFFDRHGGQNFGHGTTKGNKLIAESLAELILTKLNLHL